MAKDKKLSAKLPRFRKKELIVFGLVFAAIGGYFLWQALASTPLHSRSHFLQKGSVATSTVYNSSGTEIYANQSGTIRWEPGGKYADTRKTYALFGFRLIDGNPGRMMDFHTHPGDAPYGWTPLNCAGGTPTGVAPVAVDYYNTRGLELVVQPEDWAPCDPGSGQYHYQIMSPAEIESKRGQWIYLWLEIIWGRSDGSTPNDGGAKVWVAGEDTPRVNRQNISTHWYDEGMITFWQMQYWCGSCGAAPTDIRTEYVAPRFGKTPKEAYEDVPTFQAHWGHKTQSGQSPAGDGWNTAQITSRSSTEPAIPLSLRWSGTSPPPSTPTVSLSANPTIISSGQSSTLSWSSTNATSCSASGAWSGSKATSGTQSVSPTATSIYTLTCTGSGGSATASATVTVNAAAPTISSNINNGDSVPAGTTWSVSVSPTPTLVEFWSDGVKLADDTSAPFSTVLNLSAGTHRLGLCTTINGQRTCQSNVSTGIFAIITITAPSGPPAHIAAADLNNDGKVNILDLSILLKHYGTNAPEADINGDGVVNITDLSALLSKYE